MKTWVFWLEIFISNLANFMKLPYLFSEHCHLWTFVEFQATCQTFSYFWKETNKFRCLISAKMNHNQLTRSSTPYRNDDFYSQNNTKNKTRKKKLDSIKQLPNNWWFSTDLDFVLSSVFVMVSLLRRDGVGVATTEDWIAGYKKQNHCVNKTTKKKIEKKNSMNILFKLKAVFIFFSQCHPNPFFVFGLLLAFFLIFPNQCFGVPFT